eukprot:scaffold47414_cov29-Tisochrysis_lutea.AAC.6
MPCCAPRDLQGASLAARALAQPRWAPLPPSPVARASQATTMRRGYYFQFEASSLILAYGRNQHPKPAVSDHAHFWEPPVPSPPVKESALRPRARAAPAAVAAVAATAAVAAMAAAAMSAASAAAAAFAAAVGLTAFWWSTAVSPFVERSNSRRSRRGNRAKRSVEDGQISEPEDVGGPLGGGPETGVGVPRLLVCLANVEKPVCAAAASDGLTPCRALVERGWLRHPVERPFVKHSGNAALLSCAQVMTRAKSHHPGFVGAIDRLAVSSPRVPYATP